MRQLICHYYMNCVKRIWYLSPMRAAKAQASLRIRAVSPEPSLLAHTSSESSGTFRQKARSLAPLNGWACAVGICHDGMLEDTNSLAGLIWQLRKYTLCGYIAATHYHRKKTKKHIGLTFTHYRKFPKYSDTQKICCNDFKI